MPVHFTLELERSKKEKTIATVSCELESLG